MRNGESGLTDKRDTAIRRRVKKSTAIATAVASVATVGALAPETPAFANGSEGGYIYGPPPNYFMQAVYVTDVFGSGTHISGMQLEWTPIGGNYAGKSGFVEYARGSNGEPVGSALGGRDFNMASTYGLGTGGSNATYEALNVTGINNDPYCDFIFIKGSNNSLIPINEGSGIPACVTLST
jgi:hypothetical protein